MLDYLVLYLTVYPIILYIYSNVRGEKLNYVEKIIAVIAFIAVVQGCFYFLPGNFIVLILLSYFKNRELPVSLHVFYGIFPWLVEGIFRRLTAFYFLPTLGLWRNESVIKQRIIEMSFISIKTIVEYFLGSTKHEAI
jgi:two-component system sensor histidine kinase AgrC